MLCEHFFLWGQIHFWIAAITLPLCMWACIPLKYIIPTNPTWFYAVLVSISSSTLVFHSISLPLSYICFLLLALVLACSWVVSRPIKYPQYRLQCGLTTGKLFLFLCFTSTLPTPHRFSHFPPHSKLYFGWGWVVTCILDAICIC